MKKLTARVPGTTMLIVLLITTGLLAVPSGAQDRLKTMPGYEQYQRLSKEIPGAVKSGSVAVKWQDGGKAFTYQKDGKSYRYDIATGQATETGQATGDAGQSDNPMGRRPPGAPERGRQLGFALSPDGKLKAFYRDRNLWLSNADGSNEMAISKDGSEPKRIKYAVASWVYGEELRQTTAMWWSPNNKKIAFYRFDEGPVKDYYLQLDQTQLQSRMDVEAYPKAGTPNPIVELFIYDVDAKQMTPVDVRDGKPFDNAVVGHYVYRVAWSQDSSELLFNRTNRRQNIMELTAANPATGKCRVIVREEWPASWTENSPEMRFLADGKRFVWTSERTGWRNCYLYDLSGKLIATLTNHPFEVASIVQVDETAGQLYYMARDGDNHMKLQLHRVGLDGLGDRRLTDPAFNHTVSVAPDGQHFVDVAQTHDQPPLTRLMDGEGKPVAELAKSDTTKFEQLGLKRVELFTYKAADGVTELHGLLHFPSNFDPARKYPLLVSVYAGPATNGARETFTPPNAITEY
ncbi:MAG TPA: DPP IV N-terminal domain-containing protein, partial [Blastocatellia bacterium]